MTTVKNYDKHCAVFFGILLCYALHFGQYGRGEDPTAGLSEPTDLNQIDKLRIQVWTAIRLRCIKVPSYIG